MATQFQIAFSNIMRGAGIVAGGPYMCAQGEVSEALTACMKYPNTIYLNLLNSKIMKANKDREIDSLENLENQTVYLYSGTKDQTVHQGVMEKLKEQYESLGVINIKSEFNIASNHAWITNDYGNICNFLGTPYIDNCNYDQAGEILKTIYGDIKEPVNQIPENLLQFSQSEYRSNGDSLEDIGYMYVPTRCQKGDQCKIHISFHGCLMTLADISTQFVKNSGLNGYAESNNIIILYPQAKKSLFAPMNQNGCFDWWGYTDSAFSLGSIKYATKKGSQMITFWNIIQDLVGENNYLYHHKDENETIQI